MQVGTTVKLIYSRIIIGPFVFFFGGRNREISLSDTYFLDTDTWIWRKIFSIDNPPPRYHHAVAKTENKEAYIFGGYDEKRNRCLGDLFRYEYSMIFSL